jgi:hypothetical protein
VPLYGIRQALLTAEDFNELLISCSESRIRGAPTFVPQQPITEPTCRYGVRAAMNILEFLIDLIHKGPSLQVHSASIRGPETGCRLMAEGTCIALLGSGCARESSLRAGW